MPYLEFPNISLLKRFTSLSSSIIRQKFIKNEGEQGKNYVSRNNLIKQSIYVLQTKELGNRETPLSWETEGLLWPRGCSLSKASLALNTMANPWPDFLELCHCPDILETDATCFSHTGSFWGTSDMQNSIRLGPLVKAHEFLHWQWFIINDHDCPQYHLYSSTFILFPFFGMSFWLPKWLFLTPPVNTESQRHSALLIRSHTESREFNHSTHHFPFLSFSFFFFLIIFLFNDLLSKATKEWKYFLLEEYLFWLLVSSELQTAF